MNTMDTKKRWHVALRWLLKLALAGVVSVALLSAVTLGYSYTGAHITNETGATDYRWKPGQLRSTASEGFAWLRYDQNGYQNAAVPEDVDVLVMGSSHMEAFNVPQNASTAAVLGKLLPELRVYNIGTAGHELYQIVQNLPAAVATFAPARCIVIETATVSLDAECMRQVLRNEFPEIPSYDSGLVYQLQKIPCLKLLYKQFEELCLNGVSEADADAAAEADPTYDETLTAFLRQAAGSYSGTIYLFYHPMLYLSPDGSASTRTDARALASFQRACEAAGIVFVDCTETFLSAYHADHLLPHGFINTRVAYGHLNADGHRLIAERLSQLIRGDLLGKEAQP